MVEGDKLRDHSIDPAVGCDVQLAVSCECSEPGRCGRPGCEEVEDEPRRMSLRHFLVNQHGAAMAAALLGSAQRRDARCRRGVGFA
jgi:hypothetical protein